MKIGVRAGGVLEMISLSQSPRDRILWILANNGGKMERSRLRAAIGMRYAMLIPILDELAREGRIKMTLGKNGEEGRFLCVSEPFGHRK